MSTTTPTSAEVDSVPAPNPPPDVTTVTVHTPTGLTLTILAQPTQTPGLYVTPQIGDNRDNTLGLTGYWEVTHGPSGLALPVDGRRSCLDIHTAVRVADALAETGVDWTAGREHLIELLKDGDLIAKVRDAIKRGKYPPTDGQWDSDGDKPVSPGDYPNTAEQAGAAQMASAYTVSALQRYADMHVALIKYDRDDEHGRRLYVQNLVAMLAEYGIVHLLRAFAAADPDAADAAARDLWEAHQAGDSHGEWLSEWGREYGVETPVQGDAANAGTALPEQLSYERVMATSLAYPDHGTVGMLRQELGRCAALHNEKFSAICDQMRQWEPGHKATPEENNEFYRAHSGAMAGWGLVAVLGWLAKEFPQVAIRAARMVDDVGTNGGNNYCQDIDLDGGVEPEPTAAADTAGQIVQ